jgi:hypothetical protein
LRSKNAATWAGRGFPIADEGRAAVYIVKILKGVKPADLLVAADEVIE